MKLNKIWGYGQLFGYSGIEGPNRYYEDPVLMTMKKKLEFRYEFKNHYIKFNFDTTEKITFEYVMSDFIVGYIGNKKFVLTFADNDTLVGLSPVLPSFKGERKLTVSNDRGVTVYNLDNHYLGFLAKEENGEFKFVIHNSFASTEARSGANYWLTISNPIELVNHYIDYYRNLPKPKNKKYESLYYKSLGVNKVNVHSPEGKITRMWTTPDRVPHRHMWMWDSAFHAIAMKEYNPKLAKEILLAMLEQTRDDGFMPHMANPTDRSDVTQPSVMSWAVYLLYQSTHDLDFLNACLPYLEKYLVYDLNNRDKNHNSLLEWYTEPDYEGCKCGESGLDNSPRFDFDEEMDCLDFSCYFCNDAKYLSLIYKELGNKEKETYWLSVHNNLKDQINNLLYDENDGVYYDRLFSGKLTKVLTPTSFLPMFINIMPKDRAAKMVDVLMDKSLLNSNVPFCSISQKDPRFSNDMWRGGVWLNLNYFIIVGLKNYGYIELANSIATQTLDMANKWYKKTGCIFEFFDPKNEVVPFMCERKGKPIKPFDYRKHVHSISDYNWSACFIQLLIQHKY